MKITACWVTCAELPVYHPKTGCVLISLFIHLPAELCAYGITPAVNVCSGLPGVWVQLYPRPAFRCFVHLSNWLQVQTLYSSHTVKLIDKPFQVLCFSSTRTGTDWTWTGPPWQELSGAIKQHGIECYKNYFLITSAVWDS